jgi:perosamine synthetase
VAIPYGRQSIDQSDVAAVVEVLHGDWLTQGPTVAAFEADFATAVGAPYAVAFSSGTAALHAAAFAVEAGPGTDVVTCANTFVASANCAAYVGATPRFADIDPHTYNMSPETLEAALTPSTGVVIPVHFAGLPAPIEAIRAAVGPDVRIVEDAAHAVGALAPDEAVGACTHSDAAVFSLHPVKTVTSAEGGIVTTRSPELDARLRLFRNHGLTKDPAMLERNDGGWYQEQHVLGFNYRLTDVHAALGRSQLRRLDAFVARRNEIAARYRELLAGIDGLELPPAAPDGSRHAYHLFVVALRDGAPARRRLYDGLHEAGILAQVHYPPVHLHPYYRRTYGYGEGLCPEAERYYTRCLSLPCFPDLREDEQELVAQTVRELVSG